MRRRHRSSLSRKLQINKGCKLTFQVSGGQTKMFQNVKKVPRFKTLSNADLKRAFSSCLVLINPTRYPARARRLMKMLQRIETPHILMSNNTYDFMKAVHGFAENDEAHLLIFGGDGTIHRALNVLVPVFMGHTSAPTKSMGFFRGGSGNGYHDSYELPRSLRKQLLTFAESIRYGYVVSVDIMEIKYGRNVRYGQLFGTGFDADVLRRRDDRLIMSGNRKKPKPGLLNYVRAVIISLCRLEIEAASYPLGHRPESDGSVDIRLEIREEYTKSFEILHTHAPLIEIGKRPYYGNRFKICPGARSTRGPMEVILFDFKRKRSVLFLILPLWMGWHGCINRILGNRREVPLKHYRADVCTITAKKPFDFHVDGELIIPYQETIGECIVTISILVRAVSFLIPEKYFSSLREKV